MDIETLSKALHEAGREAVEKKAVVNPNTHSKFLEWDELEEHMKEGRRIQARYLLEHFAISNKGMVNTDIPAIFEELQSLYNIVDNREEKRNLLMDMVNIHQLFRLK